MSEVDDTYAETTAQILVRLFQVLLPTKVAGRMHQNTAEALALLVRLERDWPELAEHRIVETAVGGKSDG